MNKKESMFSSHFTLFVCFVLFVINYMDRQVLAVVLEPMKKDLALTDAQAGALQTILLLGVAVFAFPISMLVDRWSRKKSMAIMAILWSACTFITGMSKNFITLFIARLGVGTGEAGFSSGGNALVSNAYPFEKRSRMLGIFTAAMPLGSAVGYILGGYLSTTFNNWRMPFYFFAVPGIIFGILSLFVKDYELSEKEKKDQPGLIASASTLFSNKTLRYLYIGYGLQNIMIFSFLVWGPAFIMRTQGVSEAKAGMTFGIIGFMAFFGSPLGGLFADLLQKRVNGGRMLMAAIATIVSVPLVLIALFFDFQGIGYIFGILFGLVFVMSLPNLYATTQDVVPRHLKAVSWGMCMLCMYLIGGGWAPMGVGVVSDILGGGVSGLKTALALSTFFGAISAILFYISSKHYVKDLQRVTD